MWLRHNLGFMSNFLWTNHPPTHQFNVYIAFVENTVCVLRDFNQSLKDLCHGEFHLCLIKAELKL